MTFDRQAMAERTALFAAQGVYIGTSVPKRNADVFVLKANPKFELLAVNSIGGEPMNGSLAVADDDIFLRTHKNLWCIGPGK